MEFKETKPPREFNVGKGDITLKDCAHVQLNPEEQITLKTESGGEYDVVRKSWGFYATPSLNGRLPKFGLRAALVRGLDEKYFVYLVEKDKEQEMFEYMEKQGLSLVTWLDSGDVLKDIEQKMSPK